ncbi:MAG TPA: hypothetical protein VHO90_17435 [Bacteroidales bacterium]|nr:hypothetical protein [Bacteroidales bacterium]
MVTIDAKIDKILSATKKLYSAEKLSAGDSENKVNVLLDTISECNKDICRLTSGLKDLNDSLIAEFNSLLPHKEFIDRVQALKQSSESLILFLVKSPLYSGVAKSLMEYKTEHENLTEFIDDFIASKKTIPSDEAFQELIKKFESL